MSSRPSFAKRQKEQARKEKRRAKLERQQQRKRKKQLSAQSGDIPASDLARGFITSVDLIYGLPAQTLEGFVAGIDRLVGAVLELRAERGGAGVPHVINLDA